MENGYANGESAKQLQQVPTMSLLDFENEVRRILDLNQGKIDSLKKEVEDLGVVIASKRHRIASLDQEFSELWAKKQAEADELVAKAKGRLADTKSANDAAHELYDQALKDANAARGEIKSARETRAILEAGLASCRARAKELDDIKETLGKQKLDLDSRDLALTTKEQQLAKEYAELVDAQSRADMRRAELVELQNQINLRSQEISDQLEANRAATASMNAMAEALRIAQQERADFDQKKASVEAREQAFAETEALQLARENKIKLDAKAIQEGLADLERRRKNIEQREAALASKL